MNEPNRIIRICAISDTHNMHNFIDIKQLPQADIFIHAGDFTTHSTKKELQNFRHFLKRLPHKHKIVISGNHDIVFDKNRYQEHVKTSQHHKVPLDTQEQIQKIKQCCIYLENQVVEVQGIKIYGFSYQRDQFKTLMKSINKNPQLWNNIPTNVDVLVTHVPPQKILDKITSGSFVGSKSLKKFTQRLKPRVHIFGHIHESYGNIQIEGINYYNVSYCDDEKESNNQPYLIEIKVEKQNKKEEMII